MTAARHPEISDEWLLMNDDFIINQPFSIAALPYFTRATDASRQLSVQKAFRVLKSCGKPTRNYATHAPIRYASERLLALLAIYGERMRGASLRVMYGNHFEVPAQYGNASTVRRIVDLSELDALASERLCFEARARVEWERLLMWLRMRFAEPCEFEV
jgi:hypothetical protein